MTSLITELTDLEADEVSPVLRGANRKRVVLKGDGEGVDAEIQDIMSMPWEHEGAMLDLIRKEGADETVQRSAVAAMRLLVGVSDELPEALRETVEKLGRELHPVRNVELNTGPGSGANTGELFGQDDGAEMNGSADGAPKDGSARDGELIGSADGVKLNKEAAGKDVDEDGVYKDGSEPYGDVTYADTGFQSDGKKRYPLDTEDHIRAAWSYISMPKNAAKYSADDLATVKGRIKAAMERAGATVSKEEGDEELDGVIDVIRKALLRRGRRKSQDTRSQTPDDPGDDPDAEPDDDPDDDNATVKKGDQVETHAVPVRKEDGTWDLDGVPEESRGFYATILKEHDEAVKTTADLREQLAQTTFIKKAESEFDALAPSDKLGPILKAAAERLSVEDYAALEEVLKGANARIETGDLFAELGRAAFDTEGGGAKQDAWSVAVSKADELVEKAGDQSFTREQAIDRVFLADPDLYARYMREEGNRAMAANSVSTGA